MKYRGIWGDNMQRDSVRDSLTKEDIIAYIRAELDADLDNELCLVLVEGEADIKFCKRVLNENVVLYESFSGKEGLNTLIEEQSINDYRVIAIRDKDYVKIETLKDRVFVYDESCLEMMLLKNEDVLQGFFNVYCENERSSFEILNDVIRQLSPYSVARKKNEEQRLGINFKSGFGDLIINGQLRIDELFDRVGLSETLKEECKREAASLSLEDIYNITNGHDICKYLGHIAYKKKRGDLAEEIVRNSLLCSYRKNDFKQTHLYTLIKDYQLQYMLHFVS